jgi:hypothetical protein
MNAAISADIISYTSLGEKDKRILEQKIKGFIDKITVHFKDNKIFGRLILGDYIEFAMESPVCALRIALLLKTFIKSLQLPFEPVNNKRIKYFKEHGVRIAVAVAPLEVLDIPRGIIDGEAIYLSGRAIKGFSTADKRKIIIKNTMFFFGTTPEKQEKFDILFSLLDLLISKCSAKQSEVVYLKLLGMSEKEISVRLRKYQSTISQHSTAAGWQAIEKSVQYFEKTIN